MVAGCAIIRQLHIDEQSLSQHFKYLLQHGNLFGAEVTRKETTSAQCAELCQGQILHAAMGSGRAVHRGIVDHHNMSIDGELYIEFDGVCALL